MDRDAAFFAGAGLVVTVGFGVLNLYHIITPPQAFFDCGYVLGGAMIVYGLTRLIKTDAEKLADQQADDTVLLKELLNEHYFKAPDIPAFDVTPENAAAFERLAAKKHLIFENGRYRINPRAH